MKVHVLLFAQPRELVGEGRLELEVADGATPLSVFEQLMRRTPGLERLRANLRCAVDQEYAPWETPLRDGAEVAFIPPTAGG